jgi:imidazolonepropionase
MIIVRNIAELVTVPRGAIGGRAMRDVPRLSRAAIQIEEGRIAWVGWESALNAPAGGEVIDARGGCVVPGLVDCHTHTVFAGTREGEFVQRLEGKSYAQIADQGGGICVTVDAVRAASCDQLVELALPRLRRMLGNGVTTVEIKSGYGLTVGDELKMLEAVRRLRTIQPIELAATYLAAHTVPREHTDRADAYLDLMFSDAVLARIRDEKLAEFCDV